MTNYNYQGKLVVVTGASKGIGYSIAEEFVKSGADVVINGRKKNQLDQVAQELSSSKQKAEQQIYAIDSDVSTVEGAQQFIDRFKKETSRDTPHFLVNNVGFYEVKNFENNSEEDWQSMWNINVMSAVRLCQHFIQEMLKKETNESEWFRIINIASDAGLKPLKHMIPYGTCKGALISFTRGIAELTKDVESNVTANSVIVGPTKTEGIIQYLKGLQQKEPEKSLEQVEKEYFDKYEPNSLLRRFLQPREIANTVLFLASHDAIAVNGASQRCEGGIVRHI